MFNLQQLLATRGIRRVGEKWPRNFVNRQAELKVRFVVIPLRCQKDP
jgi:hypothetical protein